jgi:hypothetical protein
MKDEYIIFIFNFDNTNVNINVIKKLIDSMLFFNASLRFLTIYSSSFTNASSPIVSAVVIKKYDNLNVPVSTRLIDIFNNIHKHKSCNVDTVSTILEKFVFITPISKNIFDITGIDVIATAIIKTNVNASWLFAVPMNESAKIFVNNRASNIGVIVAPINKSK